MTGASRARPGDRPCIPDVGRTNPGLYEARRVIPRSLFVAARRHHTCLRDASERYRPLGRPARYRAKKTKSLEPHPGLYDGDTNHRWRS